MFLPYAETPLVAFLGGASHPSGWLSGEPYSVRLKASYADSEIEWSTGSGYRASRALLTTLKAPFGERPSSSGGNGPSEHRTENRSMAQNHSKLPPVSVFISNVLTRLSARDLITVALVCACICHKAPHGEPVSNDANLERLSDRYARGI
jgi:hypothetical protein